MTTRIVSGDLLKQDDVDAIVNTVNCVGVMGKGIALQFKSKWPDNFRAYEIACKAGEVRPGKMFVFDSGGLVKPNFIINFPTKRDWRGKSKIADIESGLKDLVAQIRKLRIRSIAVPPLGCGNGGLNWVDVRPLLERAFEALPDVDVRLFEPMGGPEAKSMEVRTDRPAMTRGRAAMLLVLETYKELNYGLSKIEVQKLAYFLQEAGEVLKLRFAKHEYGPYSDSLRHVLHRMNGHFIHGVGDGVVDAEIEPDSTALHEARAFVRREGAKDLHDRIERVAKLIEGFQSPYGMELLATVHWVFHHQDAQSLTDVTSTIAKWSERKRELMQPGHISAAWNRLKSESWL